MYNIAEADLYPLSVGATVLGSGGGGHPKILLETIRYLMRQYGPAQIETLDRLLPGDLVIPLAMVGAPLVFGEKVPTIAQFEVLYEEIKRYFPGRRMVLMPAEIGGCNALTPLMLALKHGLPILDADLIGRAFPKINMCKPAVLGKRNVLTVLSDALGSVMVLKLEQPALIESIVRDVTQHFGASASIATFLFDAEEADEYVIQGSLSRALALGRFAVEHKTLRLHEEVTMIGRGVITGVRQEMRHGFLFGYTTIQAEHAIFHVHFQNEYLKVTQNGQPIGGSPDLMVLLEKKTGLPLTTDTLCYGLEVDLFNLTAPSFWLLPEAKPVVDFNTFALEVL